MENTEEIYTDFARVYDELMDNTPYEMWCERLNRLIAAYGVSKPERDAEGILDSERNLVVDLGCGTGTLTEMLYQKGYDCIGVDNSEEMLNIAMDKKAESGSEILYLHQDMRELDLYSTARNWISARSSRMLTENSRFDRYSEHFERCYLEELLLMLMRHSVMNEKEPDLMNSRDADILLATRYIYNNFRKPLTLEEVSSVASLSPTYFSKKFKLITGMGFKEYLNYVRLKHAQTALLTTNSSITDIALEYGFNDSNYFKDLFKKVYGKSPREYRKNPD